MRYLLFALTFSLFSFACHTGTTKVSIPDEQIIQDAKDIIIFEGLMKKFLEQKKLPIGELVVAIGKSFEGTPYVGQTLEKGIEEKLVVNLREFDCTTFVENCLAFARTVKSDNPSYDNFLQELQRIRYRNGVRDQYPSRLHYFSDWLFNNSEKKIISLPTRSNTEVFANKVNFMSSHPDSYQQLKENPGFIDQLKKQEEAISARPYHYISKEKIKEAEDELKEGDIAGITTNIAGLDIVHTVFLTKVNGRIHLLHASSSAKKVVISDEPLEDYLATKKIQTGIMIGRPI